MLNAAQFTTIITEYVTKHKITYLDAIMTWCEKNQVDPEVAAEFVKRTPSLRSKIQEEARTLSLVK